MHDKHKRYRSQSNYIQLKAGNMGLDRCIYITTYDLMGCGTTVTLDTIEAREFAKHIEQLIEGPVACKD